MQQSRNGATLTEVLMSILVMGVGVLSVISLFPAAFLRTMQATNLTHATILRYNADSLIDLDPVNRMNVFPYWQPGATYLPNAVVLSNTPRNNRRYRNLTGANITAGVAEPGWSDTLGSITPDAVGDWTCEDHSRYIIDPLGWNNVGGAFQDAFGNDGAAPFPAPTLERFNANATTTALAESLVALPDSWPQQAIGIPTAFTVNTVDLPASIDLNGISTVNPQSRVVLQDITGRVSHVRLITGIAGQQITWDAAMPIPAGFIPAQVRVETQERRYTWLLTVRRSLEGVPSIDVVTFFRRPLTAAEERVFSVTALNNLTREMDIAHNADGTQPAAKKGAFLLDVDRARWYRIQNSVAWNGTTTRVTLDRTPIDDIQNVAVPKGIVDIYPIGSKEF